MAAVAFPVQTAGCAAIRERRRFGGFRDAGAVERPGTVLTAAAGPHGISPTFEVQKSNVKCIRRQDPELPVGVPSTWRR